MIVVQNNDKSVVMSAGKGIRTPETQRVTGFRTFDSRPARYQAAPVGVTLGLRYPGERFSL